jgi:hypothetical protein
MEIRLPTERLMGYSGAQAWQGTPIRPQQPDQDPSVGEVKGGGNKTSPVTGKKECQACKSRKYADVSGDSTVSFQSPTKLSPASAEVAVRAHEQQHVVHEQARAREEKRVVVSQDVVIHYAICPECGRMYVAGGTTTTATRPAASSTYSDSSKAGSARNSGAAVGQLVDALG